jgi:hypothetical protein
MKVFIHGCSFAENLDVDWSWPTMLQNNFEVENFARSANSNQHIFLSVIENINKMHPGDTMIVSWGDIVRFYTKNPKDKSNLVETYVEHFHNETLDKEHYSFYLDRVEQLAKEAGVKLIILWSSPSDYGPMSLERFLYDHLDVDTARYEKTFEIDIRPALIFYSLAEIREMNLPKEERINCFAHDERPNHIASKETHLTIYNRIVEHL